MEMYSAKEVYINISRRDSFQCQLFLTSNKILKKELYHTPSSQILIISSRTQQVLFLFKSFFNHYTSLNLWLLQFTIKSWLTGQSKFNMNLKHMYDRRLADVPRTSHHLVSGTFPNWVRRRFVDVPFVSPVKISNISVEQGLLHLKTTFFIKSSIFMLTP